MTAALEAHGIGKRHRRRWALRACTFSVPEQSIVGLTGPNHAGKSTLLGLAVGLLEPDEGTIAVPPIADIGYVAQDVPLYRTFSVGEMLAFARATNVRWDQELALDLLAWLAQAQRAGMHEEDILALVSRTLQDVLGRRVA